MSTLADRIEDELRADLIGGLHPPRTPLRMEKLTERYGAGASPIREALSRLYVEGLIDLQSNKGFSVPALTRDDLADICFARAAVEFAAVRRAMEIGGDAWEAAVVGALHSYRAASRRLDMQDAGNFRAWQASHDALHGALISGSGSPRVEEIQRRLLAQHSRYRQYLYQIPLDFDVHEREHSELVDAVLSRDVARATTMMARHITITLDVLDHWKIWDQFG